MVPVCKVVDLEIYPWRLYVSRSLCVGISPVCYLRMILVAHTMLQQGYPWLADHRGAGQAWPEAACL